MIKSPPLTVNNSEDSSNFYVPTKQIITWHKDRLTIMYNIHNTSRHNIVILPSLVAFAGCRENDPHIVFPDYGLIYVRFHGTNSLNEPCRSSLDGVSVYNKRGSYQFFAVDRDSTIEIVYNFSTKELNLEWFHQYAYMHPIRIRAWSKEEFIISISPIHQKKIELSPIHAELNQTKIETIGERVITLRTKDTNNMVQLTESEFSKLSCTTEYITDTTQPPLIPILRHQYKMK